MNFWESETSWVSMIFDDKMTEQSSAVSDDKHGLLMSV